MLLLLIFGQLKINQDAAYAPEYIKGYYHKLYYACDWPDYLLAQSLVRDAECAEEMGLYELANYNYEIAEKNRMEKS